MSNLINLPTYEQQQEILEKINQSYFETLRENFSEGILGAKITKAPTTTPETILDITGEGELLEIMATYTSRYSSGQVAGTTITISVIIDGQPNQFTTKPMYWVSSNTSIRYDNAIAISPMFTRQWGEKFVESVLTGNTASFTEGNYFSQSNYVGGVSLPIKFKHYLRVTIQSSSSLVGELSGNINYILR